MTIRDLEHLNHEIREAKSWLARLPDDQAWSVEELEALEEVRHAAAMLLAETEATIDVFEGRQRKP